MKIKFNPRKTKFLKLLNLYYRVFNHERKAKKPIDKTNIKNIIIMNVSIIGDEVMNIPFFAVLRRNFPNAKITIVGLPWIKDQEINQNLFDELIKFDGKRLLNDPITEFKNRKTIRNTLKKINKQTYDLAIEPRGDIRYIHFMYKFHALRKVSYNYTGGTYMLTDSVEADENIIHEIDERIHLLEAIGCKIDNNDIYPKLLLTEEQRNANKSFIKNNHLDNKKIIGIHPGASLKIKQYPHYPDVIERFAEAINDKENYSIVVFCGPEEESIARPVYESASKAGFTSIFLKEKLSIYLGLVGICNYMICNDSAAGHIAAAYGISVTVIFGPVEPMYYAPRGRTPVYIISHRLACKPCVQSECPLGTEECMKSLTVNEVSNTILEMILNDERVKI